MANSLLGKLRAPGAGAPPQPSRFQAALPGDLTPWDFAGNFTLMPAAAGGPLSTHDRSQIQEWARAVAAECTHSYNPLDWCQAQAYANQALAADNNGHRLPRPVRASVTLSVPPHTFEIAKQFHEAQLKQAVDRSRRRYMADSVFADPRIAYLWWLDSPDQLPTLDSLTSFLKEMRQGEQTQDGPHHRWLSLADRFVAGLDEADLAYLVRRLPEIFRHFHRPDLADELNERYGDDGNPG